MVAFAVILAPSSIKAKLDGAEPLAGSMIQPVVRRPIRSKWAIAL